MIAVFDIGNVLVKWEPDVLALQIAGDIGRAKKFRRIGCDDAFLTTMDLARDSQKTIAAQIQKHPEFANELQAFSARWQEAVTGPISENVKILQELKAQDCKVHAITNYAADKFDESRLRFPFYDWFDVLVVSGREGMVKPDPKIFALFCERAGEKPENFVFADDSARNIEAARRFGMDAIHYAAGVDLRREFRARGLPL